MAKNLISNDNVIINEKNDNISLNFIDTYEEGIEKVIGKWIDGKPIYRKVINLGNFQNNAQWIIDTGLNNVVIKKMYGFAYRSTDGASTAIPYVSQTKDYVVELFLLSYGSQLRVRTASGWDNYSGYAVLEYTKTTD